MSTPKSYPSLVTNVRLEPGLQTAGARRAKEYRVSLAALLRRLLEQELESKRGLYRPRFQ